jgi:uncharacterized membrane protein YgcG
MKKLLLISMILGMLPMTIVAQDDDLYFVPKKKTVEKVTDKDNYGMPRETYYVGSNRSVDDYNRRTFSHYEPINNDSTVSDTISFSAEKGVYPNDSISDEDFELTKKMSRFEDYQLTDNEAFWAGYAAGRYDWAWHSPWYYSRYGWYSGWYDPWYYSRWGWYDFGYYGWYSPWYSSWYYRYDPWYYDYYPTYIVGGGHYRSSANIGAGTIRRDGSTHSNYRRGSSAYNTNRMGELRNRTVSGNARRERASRSDSRSYSNNARYNNNSNNSSYNSGSYSSSRNSGSFSSSRSSSSGGGFSGGGSFSGGSRGGGGGGSRMGGRR